MGIFLLNLATAILLSIVKVVCLLVAIAYFTLAERKIMAAVQRRVGPNVVGPFGLLQPLADGLKLAGKELAIPAQASSRIFLTVSMTVLLFALSGWATIPFGLFDHSEYLSSNTVAKILMLSDDGLQECEQGYVETSSGNRYTLHQEFDTRGSQWHAGKWSWQRDMNEFLDYFTWMCENPMPPELLRAVREWTNT
jgi:NADH:ubiquinone oxidoreductase subunit H